MYIPFYKCENCMTFNGATKAILAIKDLKKEKSSQLFTNHNNHVQTNPENSLLSKPFIRDVQIYFKRRYNTFL